MLITKLVTESTCILFKAKFTVPEMPHDLKVFNKGFSDSRQNNSNKKC